VQTYLDQMSSAPCSAVYRVCLSVQIFTVILFVLQIDAILRKEAMKAMTETFYAAIFGYDEVREMNRLCPDEETSNKSQIFRCP
ncbi:hypothetical protein XENOCAPTIV_021723, partial [Xenoophorus captivus]